MVGPRDCGGQVKAKPVDSTDEETLTGFVTETPEAGASVYMDGAKAYHRLDATCRHEAVCHTAKEYVHGPVHANGIELFWSILKRGYIGVYHKMSDDHLARYAVEFVEPLNSRPRDTVDQMVTLASSVTGMRLRYTDLTRGNGLDSSEEEIAE